METIVNIKVTQSAQEDLLCSGALLKARQKLNKASGIAVIQKSKKERKMFGTTDKRHGAILRDSIPPLLLTFLV